MKKCTQRLQSCGTFLETAGECVDSNLNVHWGFPDVIKEIRKPGINFLRAQEQEVFIVTFSGAGVCDVGLALYSECCEFGRCLVKAPPEFTDYEVDVWCLAGIIDD